jgi:hypothetical protein
MILEKVEGHHITQVDTDDYTYYDNDTVESAWLGYSRSLSELDDDVLKFYLTVFKTEEVLRRIKNQLSLRDQYAKLMEKRYGNT